MPKKGYIHHKSLKIAIYFAEKMVIRKRVAKKKCKAPLISDT